MRFLRTPHLLCKSMTSLKAFQPRMEVTIVPVLEDNYSYILADTRTQVGKYRLESRRD